jgi:hypothetical protein
MSQFTPFICNRPESDLLVALVYPVMLQFLSTIELPIRFGHPPDSRRMIWPNFVQVFLGQPASAASWGSQEISPWANTIGGSDCVRLSSCFCDNCADWEGSLHESTVGAVAASAGIAMPRVKKSKEIPHPVIVFNFLSCYRWICLRRPSNYRAMYLYRKYI